MIKNVKTVIAAGLLSIMMFTGCSSTNSTQAQGSGQNKVIKIGMSGGYYPYTFKNKDNKIDGFEVDVWNEIGKRTGYKPEFVTASFSGLFGMLDAGKVDTIANEITITDKRKDKYLFTDAYVYSGAQIMVKKGNNSITKLDDLKGKKIGVSLGSNYEQIVKDNDKSNSIKVVTYDNDGGMRQDVALGRIDAMMDDKVSALAVVQENKLPLQLAGKDVQPLENAFPFVKNDENKKIVEKVNKALVDMRSDGTLTKISKKWVNIDITKK
ncbi:amino acid ABC transporter substrate-binding protein [Clostridium carboxidivorans P7]|uniref:Extracellular solute-binding protein family 3 n=1 Tax=Clostridium carboxidivorans P7 TaxID=536227 RepID=C6PWK1_9CLOT|nr:amino acid ABC transporter substrate-binding protein [Clostridium carboxidivorans]AKN30815.1 amino acid ABC transporter substrate-binding protein [Clostridium carboxidivorans P7]EET86354.1 extracellular solute-binding protein family 3 [Clostridium carboxidivorans P7]EFG88476.1 bacterial extracellular solute-binding protein, family 3 [Clostridium carboxidivorans P7]